MTDHQKIQLVNELLKLAKDPEMRAIAKLMIHPNRRFRICEILIDDEDEKYWISIEYPDL